MHTNSLDVTQRRKPSYGDPWTAGDVQLLQSVLEDVKLGQGPVVHLGAATQRQGAQRAPHWKAPTPQRPHINYHELRQRSAHSFLIEINV